jgi:hypothetical protein
MRRYIAAVAIGAALAVSGCGSDDPDSGSTAQTDACTRINELSNEWAPQYGAEIAAAMSAEAAGDDGRKDTAVLVVRQLYVDWAEGLRAEAGTITGTELGDAMNLMADGISEIADGINTFEDVQESPQFLEDGAVAEAGSQIADLCAV